MAHKQKYYKNIDVNGHLWRLEIWQDTEVELTPKEIGPVLQSLRIAVQGSQADVDTPIVKTSLEMSFIDAPGHEEERKCGYWEEFYTSAATEYLVKLYKDGQIEWSGYVTPDSFEEDLRYRGSVSIISRDNLGYLQDFKFRMHTDDGLVDLNTLVDEAKKVIDFQMDVLGAQLFPTSSNGGDLRQVLFNIAAFRDKTWWEVLESAFYSVGVTMRYVGRNSFILAPIREQSKCGYADYEDMPTRETRFLSYGHRELVPAAKSVIDECEFDILESLVEIYAPDYQFGGQSSLTFVETSQGLESGSYSMPVYEYASQSAGVASAQAGASRLLNPYNYKLRAGGADAQQKSIHSDDVLYALSNTIRITSYEDEQTGIVTHDYYFQKVNPVVFASKIQQGGVLNMSFTFERPVVLYPDGTIGDFVESQYGERLFLQALGFKATWEGDNGVKKYLYHATLDGGWSNTDNGQVVSIPSGATEFFTNPVTVALPSLNVDGPGELRIEFYGAYFPTTVNRNGESHQGAYIRITAADIMLAGEGAVHAAKNSKTTTNYNSKNNLLIERSAELAPNPNRPLAPQMIVNNIMVQDTTGVTGAMNWAWGLGYEDMPLSVMIHKQLLCYHAQPMDLLSGELVSDDCTFDSLYTWNGKEYSLLSGSLNVLTGRIEGAVLREFIRYENLWNEIDTRVRTFALPRSQEQTEDYKTSYRYEDRQRGGMASSPDGSGYVTKKYADETYAPIALVSGVSSRLATIESYFSNAEDVDTQINKWNEIVTFLNATEETTLAGILATYAKKEDVSDLLAWYNSVGVHFKKRSDGTYYVEGDFFTEGQFAAAVGAEGGGSVGATYLSDLYDVSLGSLLSGDILSWNGSEWVNIKQSSLVPDLSAYASKSFVSDALEGYLPKSGGTISGSLQIGNDDNTAYNYLRLVREGYEMYVNCNAYGGYISYGAIGAANAQLRLVSDSITFNGNTLIHSENIGDYSFVPKSDNLISNVNADNYLSNGVYLNQTGNGSGNSNFPQSYSIFATFAQSEQYLAQLSIGYNSFYFRRKIDTWDEWREVIHSGNYSEYALPLSGGILRDSWSGGTEIRRSDSNNGYASLIFSQFDGTILGRFGFGGVDNPLFITQSGAYKTLIHSGNIGSQSVSYASNAGLLGGLSKADFYKGDMGVIPTVGNLAALDTGCYWVYENLGEASSVPSTYSSLVAFGKSYYSSQMCVMHNASRAWLRGVYNSSSRVSASEWHELAFTDSNVAGATRLVTPSGGHVIHLTDYTLYIGDSVYPTRTTNLLGKEIVLRYGANAANGLILNPSGNVTIGAGDFASTTTKLYVDGGIRFAPRTIWGQSFDGTSGVSGTMRYVSTIHFATYDNGSYGIYQGNWYAEGLSNRDLALHFDKVHFSGNVLIGSTTDNGAKLQVAGDVRIGAPNLPSNLVVNGNTRICRRYDDRTYLDIICEDVFVNYEAYDTDGFCSHVFKSNGSDILTLYGFDNSATFWGSVLVSDTLTAQNGITTNEITIGGIKLDVYNGALRVNGDIFSTGQFAASVAGEATGGSNIVLDYASIVNALGYTPANNNNLAQVAFTGSYSSLSGTPDVYTKADVYNKNEINQKLAGVGGGGGSVGSTFGIDYINGQSFDMPNGVNCITSYNDATVDFSSIVPADPSLPCIVYIVKCDYHTLQVTSGCNIVSVNSSGDEVIDFSINGMTGMMLAWEPDYWRWFAYLQK